MLGKILSLFGDDSSQKTPVKTVPSKAKSLRVEKRACPRYLAEWSARVWTENGPVNATTMELAFNGFSVTCPNAFRVDGEVRAEIDIPDGLCRQDGLVVVLAVRQAHCSDNLSSVAKMGFEIIRVIKNAEAFGQALSGLSSSPF